MLFIPFHRGYTALAWMQMELKRELSFLREQIQHGGEKDTSVDAELVKLTNILNAQKLKEKTDAETIGKIQASMTKERKEMEEMKSSLTALQKSVLSEQERQNLPQELQSLKKEVATVGSNVASLKDATKKTATTAKESAAKVAELEKKLASEAVQAAVVKDINASVDGLKAAVAKLTKYGKWINIRVFKTCITYKTMYEKWINIRVY